jgi:site-specific DNA-cytosine methylase
MGYSVFSVDIKPFDRIDLAKDILGIERSDIPFEPDVIWASPPCTTFSIASVSHHWAVDKQPKTDAARTGVAILEKTLQILSWFPNTKWFIENPRE